MPQCLVLYGGGRNLTEAILGACFQGRKERGKAKLSSSHLQISLQWLCRAPCNTPAALLMMVPLSGSDRLFYVPTISTSPQLRYNDSRFLFGSSMPAKVAGSQQQIMIIMIVQREPGRSDNAEEIQGLTKRVTLTSKPLGCLCIICHHQDPGLGRPDSDKRVFG